MSPFRYFGVSDPGPPALWPSGPLVSPLKAVNLTTHRTTCPVKIPRKISPAHGLTPFRGGEVACPPLPSCLLSPVSCLLSLNYQLQIHNACPPEQIRPSPVSCLPSPVFPRPPRNTTASASTATVVQPRPASSSPVQPPPHSAPHGLLSPVRCLPSPVSRLLSPSPVTLSYFFRFTQITPDRTYGRL